MSPGCYLFGSSRFKYLNWDFLDSIQEQMNFPTKWRKWIQAILALARSSVLINGSPSFEFQFSRGLRPGDPISPFLFLIGMEAFSIIMEKAADEGIFQGIKLPNKGPSIMHLLFVDDALLVGEWEKESVLNMAKSSLFGIGVSEEEVKKMAKDIGCQNGKLPCVYLGLMIRANMNNSAHWKSVLQVFDKRQAIWKKSILLEGGHLTLIKAVMEAIPTYYFSLYKAPTKIINQLEAKRRNFF
ncbi:uncharacterized protein LOC110887782 [Helianthus annuus]|uniref:uncharacterized protein LOC110887782 n=1 Tax=Helianthus annuus TaxID=4232 RepID=UPI000B9027BD|nr:uncharacterized protein LOC110887782 [Helianthus annuus]